MEHAWLYSALPQDLKETTFDSSGDSAEGIFITASAVAHHADQVYIYIQRDRDIYIYMPDPHGELNINHI